MAGFIQPQEIQQRLRKQYLGRLSDRLKQMRKNLVNRDWALLRADCRALRTSSESFGYPELVDLAIQAENAIPKGEVSRSRAIPAARDAVENLMVAMDVIITEHASQRQ